MQYVDIVAVNPHNTKRMGLITVRLTAQEVDKLLGHHGHELLQQRIPVINSGLCAEKSHDAPNCTDIDFSVTIPKEVDVTSAAAVNQWGQSLYKQMVPYL